MVRGWVIASTSAVVVLSAFAGGATAAEPAVATTPIPDDSPRWQSRSTFVDGAYGSSFSRGKLDVGVRFDAPVRSARLGEAPTDPAIAYLSPAPTLSLGLRSTAGTAPAASSLIDRATGAAIGQAAERKVGVEWKPARSRVFLNRGVGIRLDGDDRVTMRLKKGSLGLFMQTAF